MIVFVKYLQHDTVQERCHQRVTKIELETSDYQPMIRIYHPDATNGISTGYLLSWFPNLEVR